MVLHASHVLHSRLDPFITFYLTWVSGVGFRGETRIRNDSIIVLARSPSITPYLFNCEQIFLNFFPLLF